VGIINTFYSHKMLTRLFLFQTNVVL